MADRLEVQGWLVARAKTEDWPSSGRYEHHGELFLFRSPAAWTLLALRYVTEWGGEHGDRPTAGRATAWTTSFADLAELRAAIEREHRPADWRALVKAGAEQDEELRALWTPVQIDLDLEQSSVHRRDLGTRSGRREQAGWQEEALGLAVGRLEELGFTALEATTEHRRVFPRGLGRAWERSDNVVVGAVVAAKYGLRVDLVAALDGFGEVYVRSADSSFDPGAARRYPPRPLTKPEAVRVEEIYRRRRDEALRRQEEEEGG